MKISELKDGDLLFIRGLSDISKAITDIDRQSCYSHVGIYFDGMIYHATSKYGVVRQNITEYLNEEEREVSVYRYPLIDCAKVKAEAVKYLGLPYNHTFYPDGEGFYCSQYVSKILPVFDNVPMKFGDDTHEVSQFWADYFAELGVKVPLGLEGTNPFQLSQSDTLVFIDMLEI